MTEVRSNSKESWVKSLLREPLLHFLVLGALIFIADWAVRSDANNARIIVIDDGVRNNLTTLFREGQGREPTPEELKALVDRWIYEEVMYREALALGLDKGDQMFRSRLELKMRALLIDNVTLDPPTDDELRQWLDSHRDRYAAPRRFDFVQFKIVGDDAEARTKATEIAAHLTGADVPSEYRDDVRIYRDRSRDNIASVFGEAFTNGLLGAAGKWVPVQSNTGWHVARMLDDKPAFEPDFEAIKPQLAADWRKFNQTKRAADAFNEIRGHYEIRTKDAS